MSDEGEGQMRARNGPHAWRPSTPPFPAPEGLREAGDLQIPHPLGQLGDRKPASDQEFLGELLADLIQQAAEGHTFVSEPPTQRPVAHVQRGGDRASSSQHCAWAMAVVCSLACGSGRSRTDGSMPTVFSSASKTGSTPKISVYRWAQPARQKDEDDSLDEIGEANNSCWMV
jgi:hypothetical protein